MQALRRCHGSVAADGQDTSPSAGGFGMRPCSLAGLLMLVVPLFGCTHLKEYIHNGFKVGPNYCRPPAPAAENWIDAADVRIRNENDDLRRWWTVFNDPVLNALVCDAYLQNLTLRQAGCRVLQARAQQAIAVGNFFPQTQQATGDYQRYAVSTAVPNRSNVRSPFYSQWTYGFTLAWELDFWGRFRRAVESANHSLDASVEDYDYVLVTLLGDVGTYYAAGAHLQAANRVRQGQRGTAASDVEDRRSAL